MRQKYIICLTQTGPKFSWISLYSVLQFWRIEKSQKYVKDIKLGKATVSRSKISEILKVKTRRRKFLDFDKCWTSFLFFFSFFISCSWQFKCILTRGDGGYSCSLLPEFWFLATSICSNLKYWCIPCPPRPQFHIKPIKLSLVKQGLISYLETKFLLVRFCGLIRPANLI